MTSHTAVIGIDCVRKIVGIYSCVKIHLHVLVTTSVAAFCTVIEKPDRAVFLMPKLLSCLAEILRPIVHSKIILLHLK